MPFYNVEKYLSSAIKSILAQSFQDFELLLINDGSTDRSLKIAEKFAKQDPRIVLLSHSPNTGIARSCNEALRISKGTFIARSDADDLALPDRLEKQLIAAKNKPDIGIWGGSAYQLQGTKRFLFTRETNPNVASINLLFSIPIINTTFFARRSALQKTNMFYDPTVKFEDYELMIRLAGHTQFANIIDPVMQIRINPNSYTYGLTATEYLQHFLGYQEKLLHRMGLTPTLAQLSLHARIVRYLSRIEREWNFSDLTASLPSESEVTHWFNQIIQANQTSNIFNPEDLTTKLNQISSYFRHITPPSQQPSLLQRSARWMERKIRQAYKGLTQS